jgi:hypothetical protein
MRKLEKFILHAISVLPFWDSSLGLSLTKPKPGPIVVSGSGLSIDKPEPAEVQLKLGLAHQYLLLPAIIVLSLLFYQWKIPHGYEGLPFAIVIGRSPQNESQ